MMSEYDLELREQLEDLGFSYDIENGYWVHYGDLTIDESFNIDGAIFIDGNFIVNGNLSTKELIVDENLSVIDTLVATDVTINGNLNVDISIKCDDLSCFCLDVESDIDADDITVYGNMNVGGDLCADMVTVYGKITIPYGSAHANLIKANQFKLDNVCNDTGIETF